MSSLKSKKMKLIIVLVLIILVFIAGIILYFLDKNIYEKYDSYESFMDTYGFSKLYNNGNPRSSEYVSNIEAIKIIIAASYNNNNSVYSLLESLTTDQMWYDYAKEYNLLDISENDYNKNITMIDTIKCISNSKNNILNMDVQSDIKPTFSDYNKYGKREKYSITDLVSSGILDNSTKALNGNKKIRKGEFNKLIATYVKKYTLIVSDGNLIENSEEQPSNMEEYPYVIDSVEKELYEQEFVKENQNDFISPRKLYKVEKSNYNDIIKMCEEYFNCLLNINYQNINKESFINSIKNYVIDDINENTVQQYINYIINNHVIISGKSSVLIPIIYNDGVDLRVRIKLDFSVVQADTKENLLYLDELYEKKIIYKDQNTIYIDAKLGYTLNSDKVYNYQRTIYSMILDKYRDEIELKEK